MFWKFEPLIYGKQSVFLTWKKKFMLFCSVLFWLIQDNISPKNYNVNLKHVGLAVSLTLYYAVLPFVSNKFLVYETVHLKKINLIQI